jgi:hypothetical protein
VAALAGAVVLAFGAGGAPTATLRLGGVVEEGEEERREDARTEGALEFHGVPASRGASEVSRPRL